MQGNQMVVENNGGPLQQVPVPPAPQETVQPKAQPLLTLLAGYNIKICYGCKSKFASAQREPPNDLIIKLKVKRDRLIRNRWVAGWKFSWAYFHLDLNCMKLEEPTVEVEDIYIPNDVRAQLTAAHIQLLERKGWWVKMKKRFWYVHNFSKE